jgi:membrane fusion protein (multidrug efflux system)
LKRAALPPASGAIFAPVPPDNATGNFTKIVQRLPVKILISPDQPLAGLLRVGFSVETAIDTHLEDVVDRSPAWLAMALRSVLHRS